MKGQISQAKNDRIYAAHPVVERKSGEDHRPPVSQPGYGPSGRVNKIGRNQFEVADGAILNDGRIIVEMKTVGQGIEISDKSQQHEDEKRDSSAK